MSHLPARHRAEVTDTGNGRIAYRVTRPGTYYVTAGGDTWRVHDCVMQDRRLRRVELEPSASSRVFVGPSDQRGQHRGVRKLFCFRHGERHELSPAACERQLQESEFLRVSGKFDSSERAAR